jgi:methionyl-tRNA formyltransferase
LSRVAAGEPVKLVYLGSPLAAVAPLRALVAAGHEVLLVVSQSDKRRGRGSELSPSPVKAAAIELGLTVSGHPDDVVAAVAQGAELGVVVAYGRLIKPHLLAAMPFVNIHFSLLPRWRGAAPVERALLAGDVETGCCLMALDVGLDTGPVYAVERVPIAETENAATLLATLVEVGTKMLVDHLAEGFDSLGIAVEQQGEPTYAAKLAPAEFEIAWGRSATEINRWVRLGGAWTTFRGKRCKVHAAVVADNDHALGAGEIDVASTGSALRVGTGSGVLEIVRLQPEGKAVMDVGAWRNGAQLQLGECFQ